MEIPNAKALGIFIVQRVAANPISLCPPL